MTSWCISWCEVSWRPRFRLALGVQGNSPGGNACTCLLKRWRTDLEQDTPLGISEGKARQGRAGRQGAGGAGQAQEREARKKGSFCNALCTIARFPICSPLHNFKAKFPNKLPTTTLYKP